MITGKLKEPGQPLEELGRALEQELLKNILPYWMKFSPDHEHGGFNGHVTHFNQVVEKANKGAVLNARILWTFSAAYRMFPEKAYLETADRAYRYIQDHFVDRELGGVFWELNYKGEVVSPRKQIYAIAYVIYAMTEYWMATGEQQALETAITLFAAIERYALDRDRNGYTEALARDWTPIDDVRLSDKDDNESKTMNTHLHILEAYANLFRVWKDPRLERALENIIVLFLDKFVDPETHHLNLFFDESWNLKSSLISYGHEIECSWLLHEAAVVLGKPGLTGKTEKVAVNMARKNFTGLDSDHGLFYELFPLENRLDTDKHWWPQAEAMVGYFNAYQLSGDEEFANKALNSWRFISGKIIDRTYGEWYWSVNREGVPMTEKEKAGFWKCPYHNGRACMEIIRRINEIAK